MRTSSHPSGAVAAGHPHTVEAAESVLRAGGNAVDASLAGLLAACVVEPALASLGGGGFLLASGPSGAPRLFDFFVQTPRRKRPSHDVELRPVAPPGAATGRSGHVGLGTVATPGVVRGVFEAHAELGRTPLRDLFAPAIAYAREGTELREFDAAVLGARDAVLLAHPGCAEIYASPCDPTRLVSTGERLVQRDLGDTLEVLSHEGPDLLYRGEIATLACTDMAVGGHLTRDDLAGYRVERRDPLAFRLAEYELRGNPPPSSAGLLLAFALALLEGLPEMESEGAEHLRALAWALELTDEARVAAQAQGRGAPVVLRPDLVAMYRDRILRRSRASRGTTHISVLDAEGGAASLTVSNGDGAGYVVPGTGILLNNLLGAEAQPAGPAQRWRENERMTSLMSPVVGRTRRGHAICLGASGSNRIHSAVLGVLTGIVMRGLDAAQAVARPRLHVEPTGDGDTALSVEGGLDPEVLGPLLEAYPRHRLWERRDMFFGGTHVVAWNGDRTQAAGDPRRGGVGLVLPG